MILAGLQLILYYFKDAKLPSTLLMVFPPSKAKMRASNDFSVVQTGLKFNIGIIIGLSRFITFHSITNWFPRDVSKGGVRGLKKIKIQNRG